MQFLLAFQISHLPIVHTGHLTLQFLLLAVQRQKQGQFSFGLYLAGNANRSVVILSPNVGSKTSNGQVGDHVLGWRSLSGKLLPC